MQISPDAPASAQQSRDVTAGDVWSEVLAETSTPPVIVNRTHFPPRARTCWHQHPHGQVLLIEQGTALVQERGGPVVQVPHGGRIVCPPGIEHWHGATPSSTMTQLAVTGSDGSGVYAVWGEQVTEQQYESEAHCAGTSAGPPITPVSPRS